MSAYHNCYILTVAFQDEYAYIRLCSFFTFNIAFILFFDASHKFEESSKEGEGNKFFFFFLHEHNIQIKFISRDWPEGVWNGKTFADK